MPLTETSLHSATSPSLLDGANDSGSSRLKTYSIKEGHGASRLQFVSQLLGNIGLLPDFFDSRVQCYVTFGDACLEMTECNER